MADDAAPQRRIARGAALPAAVSALPSEDELRQVFDGSNRISENPLPSPPNGVAAQEDQWTVR